MSDRSLLQLAGLGVIVLLVMLAIGAILGIPLAGRGAIAVLMLGGALLGVQELASRQGKLDLLAGFLLIYGGLSGVFMVAVSGENPFTRWSVLIPLSIGLAITFMTGETEQRSAES